MNVLVPKKGSKEQVKLEEGRIIYAMLAKKPINLANMIVDRLRAAMGRKSSSICYGMHLMEIMERAGVNLMCVESDESHFNSSIDHHTLQRLGYKKSHSGWDFVDKGKEKITEVPREEGQEEEEEEEGTQAPQEPQVRQPSHPPQPRSRTTPSDLAHLQTFLCEQIHLLQATLLSRLDSLDSRVQNLENHLIFQPHPSPHVSPIHDPSDPKGKRPVSPFPSYQTPPPSPPPEPFTKAPSSQQVSPSPTDLHIRLTYKLGSPAVTYPQSPKPPSPIPEPQPPPSPLPLPFPLSQLGSPTIAFPPSSSPIHLDSSSSHSPSSSSSSSSSVSADHYTLAARLPISHPRSPSVVDSEATESDHHSPPPPPPPPRPTTTTYRRRRTAVFKLFPPYVPRILPPP